MEEDEEVVLKNSGLYTCLVEAGFQDFEIIEKPELQCSPTLTPEAIEKTETFTSTEIFLNWQEYESYIQSCLRSKLVFADDASFVEHYMAALCTPPSNSYIFSALKVISLSAVGLSFNTCRFLRTSVNPSVLWSIQTLPLVVYGIHFSYFKYQKFRRKKVVTRLLTTLKELSLFVQKSVQFVLNRSVIAFISDQSNVNHEENTYLEEVVFSTLRSTILELKSIIVALVKHYPLKEAVETHQYYLAYLSDEDLHCIHPDQTMSAEYLQKMKYAYFLLQSEFLRRFCLCLIPSLQETHSNNVSISQLFQRLTTTTEVCSQLSRRLKSNFEMFYLFEKRPPATRARESNANWAYREAYVKLCSLSSNLQSVLRQSRRLEQTLEDVDLKDGDYDRVVCALDAGARRIDGEHAKCVSALDDFRKYVLSLRPKRDEGPVAEVRSAVADADKTRVSVGKSDFRPQWPDEVFVGVSCDGDVQPAEPNDVQPEGGVGEACAQLLISELKMALRDKAQEWKRREKEALRSKEVDVASDDEEVPAELLTRERGRPQRAAPVVVVAPVARDPSHLSESSLAKQIAAASMSWQMREEQHFSFGSDDDDSDDSGGCDERL